MFGGLETFDCALRKKLFLQKYEVTYVGQNQMAVRDTRTNHSCPVHTQYGSQIKDVNFVGDDPYVVAYTDDSMIICSIEDGLTSEVCLCLEYCANANSKWRPFL